MSSLKIYLYTSKAEGTSTTGINSKGLEPKLKFSNLFFKISLNLKIQISTIGSPRKPCSYANDWLAVNLPNSSLTCGKYSSYLEIK